MLITVDTLRADRVGACGGPAGLTPALDALGRSGTVFLDATAHAPLTLPSHTSILTGRFPIGHGVHDNAGFVLAPDIPTLATLAHGAGYQTAAFVSSFVLRGSTGLARGFDVYDDRFEGAGRSHLTLSSLERRGPEVGRLAAKWLATARQPFFLWVHFYDPHAPYDPPPAFAAKFPGRPYEGEVAAADFGVQTVLDALPANWRDNTIVVATGDHGEGLGEHGEREHGILLYDSTLHVPLLLAGPGVTAGKTVRDQARHVDIVPTVLDLLGIHVPNQFDGTSLVRPHATPASYAESRFGELHFGWRPVRSLRDGTWKYIDAPTPELYQVSIDAGERENRAQSRQDTASALKRGLAALTAGAPRAEPAHADADAAARLRSLGYVSGRVTLDDSPADGIDPKDQIARYQDYVEAFNDAMAELEENRPREAERAFRSLAGDFPRSFEAHQYLGRSLAARGAYGPALAEFDAAIALSPNEAAVYFDEAKALGDMKQFDRAFNRVAEGLRIEPASFYGWLTRGLIARAAGHRGAASQAFREALQINPDLAVAHLELGRLAESAGDLAGAAAQYQRALDGDRSLEEARQALARLGKPSK